MTDYGYGYNNDFSDEDANRLVQLASAASESKNRFHSCGWVTTHGLCGASVQGCDFSEHLRTCHGVVGPEKAPFRCYWANCGVDMRRESVIRHVQEVHLEWNYRCPHCQEHFTRVYTMQTHIKKQHFGG